MASNWANAYTRLITRKPQITTPAGHSEHPDRSTHDGSWWSPRGRRPCPELWARLGKLPARQRAAVVLRYYEDLDDASIADILGCSLSTVRSLVFRAIEELRRTTDSVMSTGRKGGA
ncbi:RNA polymerase sigma factor [Dactylosporangium sp. NPDC000521]|uniref:RNA polymerase sigma factor n=1 Tax=Dactylosporangium sp. NPDC000521 TaxID=3363975 RepID=UPI0036BEC2B6